MRLVLALLCLLLCRCDSPDGGLAADDGRHGGTWDKGPSLPAPARTEVAAVTAGGRIYVLGGLIEAGPGSTGRVDVYDPAKKAWTKGPELPETAPRHHLAVAALGDTVYLVGGYLEDQFTPGSGTFALGPDGAWRKLRDAPVPRGAATAQALRDATGDKIFVAGGTSDGSTPLRALSAYDPATDQWTELPAMTVAREHLSSCALGNRLLVLGGRTAQAGNLAAAEAYDPMGRAWTTLPPLPTARGGIASAALDGVCFVLGGERPGAAPPNTFGENEGFDGDRGRWLSYPPLPTARHGLGAAALGAALYLISGGPTAGYSFSTTVEVFTPSPP